MRLNDTQLGTPETIYRNTKSNIESLSAIEGMVAYATDTNELGTYNGSAWVWGQGGGTLDGLTDVVITLPSSGQLLSYSSGSWINVSPTTGRYRQFLYTVISGCPTFLTDNSGNILTVALDLE